MGTVALGLTLALTHATVGYGVDSSVYLGVAHNLVNGRGPTVPMTFYTDHYSPARAFGFHGAVPSTHFPPLYSIALALLQELGLTATTAARTTAVALHAINASLVVLVFSRILTVGRWPAAIAGAALLFTIDTWLVSHSFAMSEALLITMMLASFLVLARHLATGSRTTLALLATFAAAAVLTRWVGISVGFTGAVLLIGRVGWPRRMRVVHASFVVGAAIGAAGGWSLYGRLAGGSEPRLLAVHAPARFLGSLLQVVTGWFAPTLWAGIVLGAALVLASTVAALRTPRGIDGDGPVTVSERTWLLRAGAVFAVAYVVVVFVSRTFLDISIPTGGARGILAAFEGPRIYVPLLPVVLGALLATLDWTVTILMPSRSRAAGLVVPIACVAFAILPPSHLTEAYDQTSRLIAGVNRPPSLALLAVRHLPVGAPIATNEPSAVYSQAGRPCLMVPLGRIAVTGETNPDYEREITEMATLLVRHHGYLVLGSGGFGTPVAAGAADFSKRSRLVPLTVTPTVSVYRVEAQ
ncbi:MAG: hypothetical protein ABJC79_11735 [Acidimicrobiia bacterium]